MKKRIRGVGVIEIVLILVVIIALVLIFREQLTNLVTEAFRSINNNASNIIN